MRHDECRIAILRGESNSEVEGHLRDCLACARLARAMGAVQADLRQAPPITGHLAERVLARIAEQRGDGGVAQGPGRATPHRTRGTRHEAKTRHRLLVGIATLAAVVAGAFVIEPMLDFRNAAIAMTRFSGSCGQRAHEPAGASGGGDIRGQHVLVAGVWSGEEKDRFAKVLKRFEQATGAKVTYAYETHDIAPKLEARIRKNCPPDVALLPQPALMLQLAKRRKIEPIDDATAAVVRRNYPASWRNFGTVDGTLYGVWFKAANKSIVWYNRAAFRRAGVRRPPQSWRGLTKTAGQLSAVGTTPFSVAGSAADGWTATDWFENVYLRTAGPERYDKLARHKIPWTDRSVKRALRLLAQIFDKPGWIAGGSNGILETSYKRSVQQVFGERPKAAMVYEGDFVSSEIPTGAQATLRRDVDFFDFPRVTRREPATLIGGDVAVRFTRNEAAKRLIGFLATPEAAEPWARSGGFVSPNKNLDQRSYVDPLSRRSARALQAAKTIRFDLSDQQRTTFGATMWDILRRYLARPGDVDKVARRLEQAAAVAMKRGESLNGQPPPPS